MSCFFALILSGVMVGRSSLVTILTTQIFGSKKGLPQQTCTLLPHFLFCSYMVCRPIPIFGYSQPHCVTTFWQNQTRAFLPQLLAKMSFETTLSFSQPQSLCHEIYNFCLPSLAFLPHLQIFVDVADITFINSF